MGDSHTQAGPHHMHGVLSASFPLLLPLISYETPAVLSQLFFFAAINTKLGDAHSTDRTAGLQHRTE